MFENHGVDQVDILSPGQRLPVEIFPGIIAGKMLVNVTAEVTLGIFGDLANDSLPRFATP